MATDVAEPWSLATLDSRSSWRPARILTCCRSFYALCTICQASFCSTCFLILSLRSWNLVSITKTLQLILPLHHQCWIATLFILLLLQMCETQRLLSCPKSVAIKSPVLSQTVADTSWGFVWSRLRQVFRLGRIWSHARPLFVDRSFTGICQSP